MSIDYKQSGVDIGLQTRELAVAMVSEVLGENSDISELDFRSKLLTEMEKSDQVFNSGWYDPPPGGIAVLFGQPEGYTRLLFDTLRKREFWPSNKYFLTKESVAMIYLSPVHKQSGIIGDFGITVYNGENNKIKNHLKKCLKVMEDVIDGVEVGMEMREIHNIAQVAFKSNELNNNRTVTYTDKVGTNLGHTIPWTIEKPSEVEADAIENGEINILKDVISNKRVNVNAKEKSTVQEDIIFTFEARLEDNKDKNMPLVFFHYYVGFKGGDKVVKSNLNQVFKSFNMDYIKSRY